MSTVHDVTSVSFMEPGRKDCLHCRYRSLRAFCNLEGATLAEFDALGTHTVLQAGERVFTEDAPLSDVFVLCNGRAKLFATSRQGKTMVLKIAMPGDVLGLATALSGSRHEVTAEVIEPAEIKRIPRDQFLEFLERHGEASLHAAQTLSAECRATFYDARRLALSASAAGRLAGVLLEWGMSYRRSDGEMRFPMALSHEDIAGLIGSTRETVTRTLSQFKRDKLIRMHGATVVILEPVRLQNLAV